MFTRWLRLGVALVIGVLAGVAIPVGGALAVEGGQLELHSSSYLTETHAGGEFFLQSRVRNTGSSTLHDVTLTHTLPAGVVLRNYDGSYTDGNNVDTEVVGQVVTSFFPTLEPGQEAYDGVASVTADVPDVFAVGEILTGRATASSPDSVLPTTIASGVCADDPTSSCVPVAVVDGPRLTLSLEADGASALPGDTVRFLVEVRNTGSVDAIGYLVGVLPPVLEFVDSEVLTPSERGDPAEGASFFDPITVAVGETLGFDVVSTLGEAPIDTVVTFELDLIVSGMVDVETPCTDGTDSWGEGATSGCAAIAVARAGVVSPPAGRPPADRPPAGRPPVARPAVPAVAVPVPAPAALPAGAAPAAAPAAAAAAAADAPGASELSRTGGTLDAPLAAALVAVLLGALLVLGTRASAHRVSASRVSTTGQHDGSARGGTVPGRRRRHRGPPLVGGEVSGRGAREQGAERTDREVAQGVGVADEDGRIDEAVSRPLAELPEHPADHAERGDEHRRAEARSTNVQGVGQHAHPGEQHPGDHGDEPVEHEVHREVHQRCGDVEAEHAEPRGDEQGDSEGRIECRPDAEEAGEYQSDHREGEDGDVHRGPPEQDGDDAHQPRQPHRIRQQQSAARRAQEGLDHAGRIPGIVSAAGIRSRACTGS
jgi:uncharacterized repeat protein (TIGR01451 family)